MLLKNCIYFIIITVSLLSIPILIYSIKNKNKRNSKCIKLINFFYIMYLILNIAVIPNVLSIDLGLEILFLALISFFAIIIYIVSIVICSQKIKKGNEMTPFSKKPILVILLFIILPILLLSCSLFKEYYLIINSDIVLVYKSNGNGGIDDSNHFAYAINENYFEEISLGLATGDYSLVKYLPKKSKKIDNIENINNYNVSLDNNEKYITIYKNNKLIHKKQINPNYYNISFDGGFYINNE